MKFTSIHELTAYLYSLPVLHEKNDLSYIKRVLRQLNNPQNKVKTIHVTGTNGKGSTSYYLSNLLQKAGQRTGLFVSPYIKEFNERIQLNGQDIPDEELLALADQIENAIAEIREQDKSFSLVTFEYETVLAFLYFAQKKCDYAVIEVGIGAEHDKTNVIIPEVSIITTVGLDHEQIIGPTIQDIAKEKSGVIKRRRPVVFGNIPQKVLPILKQKAAKEAASAYLLGKDFFVTGNSYTFGKTALSFHQRSLVENYDISIALTAFLLLKIPTSKEKMQEAINLTKIPGRYQIISKRPLIILDGAHNIQAMSELLQDIRKKEADKKIHILITMMKDKDLGQVFALFNDEEVTLTTIPYPRAAKLADFPKNIQDKYQYIGSYEKAFIKLRDRLTDHDMLLVTGSFYLVSAILQLEDKDAS